MTDAIAQVLNWLYGIWPNYAGAIILLTLCIMVVVTPLTLKSTRSMMQMQKLQPEIRKLQQQYSDDRQRLNEELMAFYKENSINPMGGCLPLLVQMPVFFALYSVLRGLTRRDNQTGFDLGWALGQQAQGLPTTTPPSRMVNFDPAYLGGEGDLYDSLSQTNEMQSFGLDLSQSASQALGVGIIHSLPYLALIAIVAVTGFVQQRQIQGRNPNAEINPQQQMIMKFLPIMLPVFSFALPSGLVLYFAVSNTFRVGQQWWISRSIYGITKEDKAKLKETRKTGPTTPPADSPGLLAGLKSLAKGEIPADAPSDEKVDLGKGRPTPKRSEARAGTKAPAKGAKASNGRSATKTDGKTKADGKTKGSGGSKRVTPPAPKPVTPQPRARKRKR